MTKRMTTSYRTFLESVQSGDDFVLRYVVSTGVPNTPTQVVYDAKDHAEGHYEAKLPSDVRADVYEHYGMSVDIELTAPSMQSAVVLFMLEWFGTPPTQDMLQVARVLEKEKREDLRRFSEGLLWLDEHSGGRAMDILASVGYEMDQQQHAAMQIWYTF